MTNKIHAAAAEGDTQRLRELLDHGADVNAWDDDFNTPLHVAVARGNIDCVILLLDRGADVNSRFRTRYRTRNTPLHVAIDRGNMDCVILLLARGADDFAWGNDGKTPLYLAVERDHVDILNVLLDRGADINNRNRDGDTPLNLAVQYDHEDVIIALLDRGDIIAQEDWSDILGRAIVQDNPEYVSRLLESGARVGAHAGERHLAFAIKRWNKAILPLLISRLPQPVLPAPILPADNRIERVYELLKLGLAPRAIIPEVRYMYGLSSGVRSRDRRYLLMDLLINGLDPGSMEDEADTLLHSLCRGYTPSEDIALLFDVGVNIHGAYIVNLRNASGDTPLHCYLASHAKPSLAGLTRLLSVGADVSLVDGSDRTALQLLRSRNDLTTEPLEALLVNYGSSTGPCMCDLDRGTFDAVECGETARILPLIKDGATNIRAKNNCGDTLLHWAVKHGHEDVVIALLDQGIDPNEQNRRGEYPLHWAVRYGHVDVVNAILDRGGDINALNNKGHPPVHWAVLYGHWDTVTTLMDRGANDQKALLHLAIKYGHTAVVTVLLDRGADINVLDDDGKTPLYLAVERDQVDILNVLLDRGADINNRNRNGDTHGDTPMNLAVQYDHEDVIIALLDRGDIIAQEDWSDILGRAIDRDNPEYVSRLLESGARVGAHVGERHLEIAIERWKIGILSVLISRAPHLAKNLYAPYMKPKKRRRLLMSLLDEGLDLSIVDDDGDTLLHILCIRSAPAEDIGLLVDAGGIEIANTYNASVRTPLHCYLAYHAKPSLSGLTRLLEGGADTTLEDGERRTALQILHARNNVSAPLGELLVNYGCPEGSDYPPQAGRNSE